MWIMLILTMRSLESELNCPPCHFWTGVVMSIFNGSFTFCILWCSICAEILDKNCWGLIRDIKFKVILRRCSSRKRVLHFYLIIHSPPPLPHGRTILYLFACNHSNVKFNDCGLLVKHLFTSIYLQNRVHCNTGIIYATLDLAIN